MLAILKKELKMYYSSLFSYVYYMIFFLVTGVLFSSKCLDYYSTEFAYSVLRYGVYVVIVMIPFCTMRCFSQERKLRTDQLLFTAPVSTGAILAGKYIATLIYVMLPMGLSLFYPLFIRNYGTISGSFLFSGYLGGCLLVLVALSLGMFLSTLTSNYVLAAVLTYVCYIFVLLGRIMEGIVAVDGWFYNVLHELSVYNKFYDMISGVVRSGDVIYFVVLIIVLLGLTWISLQSHGWKPSKTLITAAVILVLSGIGVTIGLWNTIVFDCTPEKLLTLSDETKERVSSIDEDVYIYYVGNKSQANATYVELLSAYESLNDKVYVEYIPQDNATFMEAYFSDYPTVNEASIVVASKERYIILDSDYYITISKTGRYSYEKLLEIEDQLTSAIVYTQAKEVQKVAQITGHGESVLGSGFLNLLKRSGYELETVELSNESRSISTSFYEDYESLFICAPDEDFSEDDIAVLTNFLEKGGVILAGIDALNEDLTNLYGFFKAYGLDIQSGVVVDTAEGYHVLDTDYYLSPVLQESTYTEDILKKNPQIVTYTSKGIAMYGSGNGYETIDLLVTSDDSFCKVDNYDNITSQGESDLSGPFSIASVAENPQEGKIFLMASDIFFHETANEETGGSNARFFTEMLKELTMNPDTFWIAGKDVNSQSAYFKSGMVKKAKVVVIVVVPVVILVMGFLILILRRKNVGWRMIEKRRWKVCEDS